MNFRGKRKIAALLLTLDRNAAAQVLKNFSEEEILSIGEAMKEISGQEIPQADLAQVYEDFRDLMRKKSGSYRPREVEVRELFATSLGADKSEALLDELERRYVPISPFSCLARFPKEIIINILEDEHPQTMALVLSQIESSRAAQVITELDEDLRLELLTRMAKLKIPPGDVIRRIALKLEEKAEIAMEKENPEEARNRLRTVADVLNRVDQETEKGVLGKIAESDADMAEEIKELMFTFEDLLLVDKRAMQKILSGINVQVIALALKGAAKEVENFILGNVSSRVKKLIADEKDLLGPKPLEEVMEAKKEIVNTVRMLMESGEISIQRSSEEELLV